MTKTAIVCTGAEPRHLFPTFIEAVDIHEEDLRAGTEIVGVTTFLAETQDATRTFSF